MSKKTFYITTLFTTPVINCMSAILIHCAADAMARFKG